MYDTISSSVFRGPYLSGILHKKKSSALVYSEASRKMYIFKSTFVSEGLDGISSFLFRIYEVHTISFQTFVVWVFKIVVDS